MTARIFYKICSIIFTYLGFLASVGGSSVELLPRLFPEVVSVRVGAGGGGRVLRTDRVVISSTSAG